MRENGETIALLYHATGVGKTVTAASDAKEVGGRTLFLVNALKLADQAENTFAKIWKGATLGKYTGSEKTTDTKVIFATVQSISKNLLEFQPNSFDYIIVDGHEAIVDKSSTIKELTNVAPLIYKDSAGEVISINIDTGCCYGGKLTAMIIDETGNYTFELIKCDD